MASRIWANNGQVQSLHLRLVRLFAEIPFTTSGAVNTLTATKNLGIKACIQGAAGAAAGKSGGIAEFI